MMFLHKTPLTFHHHVHVKVCYSSVLQDGAELLRELSRADDARLLRRPAAEHEGPAEGMKTWVSKKLKITQTFLKISLSVIVVLCFSNSYMLLEYSTWPPPPSYLRGRQPSLYISPNTRVSSRCVAVADDGSIPP